MRPWSLPPLRAAAIALALLALPACGQATPGDARANVAPVVAIGWPSDGDTLSYLDYPNDGTSVAVPIVGVAVDAEDGELRGDALAWSWRTAGSTTWTDAGMGVASELVLPFAAITPRADVEIRLIGEDAEGATSAVTIEVTVIGPAS